MIPKTRIEMYLAEIAQLDERTGLPSPPVTRTETFLAMIAGQSYSTPTPSTRVELFLAKITGDDVETPAPVTRVEMILAAIARGSIVFPTPLTRLEYFLKEWAYATSDLKTQPIVGIGRVGYAVI